MRNVILIVDDNKGIREIFAQILRSHGYDTVEAETGLEAIKKTSSIKPSLVLMDLSLPDMTGADATRAIKNDTFTGTIPVIGCSAFFGPQIRDAALHAGMVDYLVKPISINLFTAKVEQFIQREL